MNSVLFLKVNMLFYIFKKLLKMPSALLDRSKITWIQLLQVHDLLVKHYTGGQYYDSLSN